MAKDVLVLTTSSERKYYNGKINDWNIVLDFETVNNVMPKEINVVATKTDIAGPRFSLTHFTASNADSFNFNNGAETDLDLVAAVIVEVKKIKALYTK